MDDDDGDTDWTEMCRKGFMCPSLITRRKSESPPPPPPPPPKQQPKVDEGHYITPSIELASGFNSIPSAPLPYATTTTTTLHSLNTFLSLLLLTLAVLLIEIFLGAGWLVAVTGVITK